jgi:hypothetical protein
MKKSIQEVVRLSHCSTTERKHKIAKLLLSVEAHLLDALKVSSYTGRKR